MKIAIVNANSVVGKPLVEEAVSRGMDVTVFTRFDNETSATKVVKKELMDITAEDLAGFDAVIDASGVWDEKHVARHYKTVFHLCDCLSGSEAKFLIVGGEGVQNSDNKLDQWFDDIQIHEHRSKEQTVSTKWFGRALETNPSIAQYAGQLKDILGDEFITMDTVFSDLKQRKDVNWLFMEPSCEIDTMMIEFSIPYSDYAKDMLDEIQYGIHYQQRVGSTCK